MKKPILRSSMAILLLYSIHCFADADERSITDYISAQQPAVEQGEIAWGAGEVKITREIREKFAAKLITSTGNSNHMKRDAHPKAHGCVDGKLSIDNIKLPEELRVGLFEKNAEYSTITRFSNADPDRTKPDTDADFRGFALKIKGVPYSNYLQDIKMEYGENVHDMVMMNTNAFFIPNTERYLELMNKGVAKYMLTHWITAKSILTGRTVGTNSLSETYNSATPYKLGNTSMKMEFKPCPNEKTSNFSRTGESGTIKKNGANFLGEKLEATLSNGEQCFDFYVQPNKDKKTNRVKNAMDIWSTEKSPMIKVGKLKILKQSGFRAQAVMKTCENMSFNPWRAPKANRPMGGVNRIRLEVYLNQFQMRKKYNELNDTI